MIIEPHIEQPRLSTARVSRPSTRRVSAFAWRVLASAGLLAACTLTSEEFAPAPVQGSGTLIPRGDSSPPASCDEGSECCEGVSCASGAPCRNGACESLASDASAPPCVGVDCPSAPVPVLSASCDDRRLNQDETDVDCGGGCDRACSLGQLCRQDGDCEAGSFCPAASGRCRAASCGDGVQNGGEALADCGGPCDGCPAGTACSGAGDCESGVCSGGRCMAPSCDDGVENQGEADIDCGGPCGAVCAVGRTCAAASDCQSAVCAPEGCPAGVAACCQAPSCDDGERNGTEPVPDCGNAACGLCDDGQLCALDEHCQSAFCDSGRCANPGTCNDNIRNGRESAIDCGGNRCPVCPDLSACVVDSDCFNNNCDPNGTCISCGDSTINGTETDFDCGGSDPFCQRCRPGQRCRINSDCASFFCFNGVCS